MCVQDGFDHALHLQHMILNLEFLGNDFFQLPENLFISLGIVEFFINEVLSKMKRHSVIALLQLAFLSFCVMKLRTTGSSS